MVSLNHVCSSFQAARDALFAAIDVAGDILAVFRPHQFEPSTATLLDLARAGVGRLMQVHVLFRYSFFIDFR